MHIAIIGNGIAGITAARFIRKLSSHRITVISAETDFFFSRTALMYIYMGHQRFEDTKPYEDWFWSKNRIDLVRGTVKSIDPQRKKLTFDHQSFENSAHGDPPPSLFYDKLILATGSRPNAFGWPGQDLEGVRGLYSYPDLQYMERFSGSLSRAVIVGGGLIGIEMAEMFHSRHIPVTFLVRETSYWNKVLPPEESQMVSRHIQEHGIDLRLGTELQEIEGDKNGRAAAAITKSGERIPCGYVGLTAGVHPNIDLVKEAEIEADKGILVNSFLQTSQPDIYAIGDCAQLREPPPGRRPIEAVWYVGRIMGETVAHNLCGHPTPYHPGIWFNSAKFMDIEYQVYGDIQAQIPENQATLYWEHPEGKKSIRINYRKEDHAVVGFNLMGVRYRHEVCEKWIAEQTPIEAVLPHLPVANFDPELYATYEKAVIAQYNQQTGAHLRLRKKRGWAAAFSFLKP